MSRRLVLFFSLLLAALLPAVPASAMQKRSDQVRTVSGQAIISASVQVYLFGTTIAATIYADNGVTTATNPVTVNALDGSYTYYAPNGRYTEVVTATGYTFTTSTSTDIIFYDHVDGPLHVNSHIQATGLHTWAGTARFPAITSIVSHTTGIFWPAAHHMAISIDPANEADKGGVELIRFHAQAMTLHHTAAIRFRHSTAGMHGGQWGHITALRVSRAAGDQPLNNRGFQEGNDRLVLGHAVTSLAIESHITGGLTFSQPECTTITSPIAGKTECLDTTRGVWLNYDGTGYQSDVARAMVMLNVIDPRFGGKADLGVTLNTAAVQAAVNALPSTGGWVYIPWGVKWVYANVTFADRKHVLDYSGYFAADDPGFNAGFTAGPRIYLHGDIAAPPTTNAGNEMVFTSTWHPAVVLDNRRVGVGQNRQTSIIFRSGGTSQAQISNDFLGNDTGRFAIVQNTPVQSTRYFFDPATAAAMGDGATVQSGGQGNFQNIGFLLSVAGPNDTTGRAALGLQTTAGTQTWLRNVGDRDIELASARNGGVTFWAIPSNNFRGQVTVTGAATTGTFTFAQAEPSTAYFLNVTPTASTGAPAAGSNRVLSIAKNTGTFVVTVEAAPGVGNSVTFDFMLVR